MGLDMVEFVMEIEDAFAFRFPDEDMVAISTPRLLIVYLMQRRPKATSAEPVCVSQRVFYRLRQVVAARLDCPARDLGLAPRRREARLRQLLLAVSQHDGRG